MNTSSSTCNAPSAETITEESIARLVDAFYARVRTDPVLGPVFERAIPGDWGPHLAIMRKFWSSVMLTSGSYKGNPVIKHQRVDGLKIEMFERWLAQFEQTCHELFDDQVAGMFSAKARRIAESLKLAVFYRPDRPWPPATPDKETSPAG